ncbi:hypothetical protein MNBD_GAMMA14-500, partial [hydrothermal vent metagenome]
MVQVITKTKQHRRVLLGLVLALAMQPFAQAEVNVDPVVEAK